MFDPSGSNLLRFAEGIGNWWSNPPTVGDGGSWPKWNWNSQTAGIEQLVAVHIISPPGGNPGVMSWDRDWFLITDPKEYPSDYGTIPYATNPSTGVIIAGWGGDWASSAPSFIAVNTSRNTTSAGQAQGSGYSNSGGAHGTWSLFSTMPATGGNGFGAQALAASTPSSMMLISDGKIQATTNGSSSWTNVTPAGTGAGWYAANDQPRLLLAADRVIPDTFYAYYPAGNVYVSENTGASWNSYNPRFSFGRSSQPQIKSIPNNAGHLFCCGGTSGGATQVTGNNFYRSINGGQTWSNVSNSSYTIHEVWVWGFGAPNGGTYPAIGIYGYVNGRLGFWASNDNCNTWTMIGDHTLGLTFDWPNTLCGDMNTPGEWYIGFTGSGYLRYGT